MSFEKINKDDLPIKVLKMLGVENPPIKVNSKNTPSKGGGTTLKSAWILVAERINELIGGKKRDFDEVKKEDLPIEVLKMLGIKNPTIKVNSKDTPSEGGGTTTKSGWVLIAERIEQLIAEGKLKI